MFIRRTTRIKGKYAISKLKKININGINQWLLIRGNNINNPILFMLHGGPGGAQIAFTKPLQAELEKDFVVVQWDQRGAGLSYNDNLDMTNLTVDQLVNDGLEVTKYLLNELNKDKLILMGYSFGTLLGIKMIQKRSDLFSWYYGVGQLGDIKGINKVVYDTLLDNSKHSIDKTKEIKSISSIDKPSEKDYEILNKYISLYKGGLTHEGLVEKKIEAYTKRSTEYNIFDHKRFNKAFGISYNHLEKEVFSYNLMNESNIVEVPITFISGKYDLIVPEKTSKEYFDYLEAPIKQYHIFDKSSHSAMWEENDKFVKILVTNKQEEI